MTLPPSRRRCGACAGRGAVAGDRCDVCEGSGWIEVPDFDPGFDPDAPEPEPDP